MLHEVKISNLSDYLNVSIKVLDVLANFSLCLSFQFWIKAHSYEGRECHVQDCESPFWDTVYQ